MLNQAEREALTRWYSENRVLEEAHLLFQQGEYEGLEAFLHRTCLLPLGQHDLLPAYMCDDDGKPLFPQNLNPMADEEKWQDAIEVGWTVMEKKLGMSHDDVHRAIAANQDKEWEVFMKSVEQRKHGRDE